MKTSGWWSAFGWWVTSFQYACLVHVSVQRNRPAAASTTAEVTNRLVSQHASIQRRAPQPPHNFLTSPCERRRAAPDPNTMMKASGFLICNCSALLSRDGGTESRRNVVIKRFFTSWYKVREGNSVFLSTSDRHTYWNFEVLIWNLEHSCAWLSF